MDFKTSFSGATFEVKDNGRLIKRCRNLYESGVMQAKHETAFTFNTPKVHAIGTDYIVMDYLPKAVPLPTYLNGCTQLQADRIVKYIIEYVHNNDQASLIKLDVAVIHKKIDHIITRLHDYNDITMALHLREAFYGPMIEVAHGGYHGDLTFSNILINEDDGHPYLIDFLPGYAPTHWLDVVKLQQEVNLNWSSYFLRCDSKVYFRAQREVNSFIEAFYTSHPIIKLLEALNYLRILPYSGDNQIIANVLRSQIKDILK